MSNRFKKYLRTMTVVAAIGATGCAAAPDESVTSGSHLDEVDTLGYGPCESARALGVVNGSTTERQTLATVLAGDKAPESRHLEAADRVLSHRKGPDGELGTWDDQPYTRLTDLMVEDVGLGSVYISRLVGKYNGTCETDYSGSIDWAGDRTADFMHAGTDMSDPPGYTTERENSEIEVAFTLRGMPGPQVRAIMDSRDGFRKVDEPRLMEAFNYGLSPDEMRWDGAAHGAREGYPFVQLTIESDRYALEGESWVTPDGTDVTVYRDLERRLSVGTDLMTDVYYDTRDYLGLTNDTSVRGRVRWDRVGCVARLLVAAKFGSGVVDPISGIKELYKVDVRTDYGRASDIDETCSQVNQERARADMAALDADVRRGMVSWWQGGNYIIPPMRDAYNALTNPNGLDMTLDPQPSAAERGSLLGDVTVRNPDDLMDSATFAEALPLEPAAHVHSVRARFHFNEANISAVRALYENGIKRLMDVRAYIDRVYDRQDASTRAELDKTNQAIDEILSQWQDKITYADTDHDGMLDDVDSDLDGNGVPDLEEGVVAVPRIDGSDMVASISTLDELSDRRAKADAFNLAMHEIGQLLANDDADDEDQLEYRITGTEDRGRDADRVAAFVAWRKLVYLDTNPSSWDMRNSIVTQRAYDSFLSYYRQNMSDPAMREEFMAYAAMVQESDDDWTDDDGEPHDNPYQDFFEDFDRLTSEEDWRAMEAQLEFEWIQVARRQIEAAGTTALGLWFDSARRFYVPSSSRSSGNFVIDTMDYTEFFSPEEWANISEEEKLSLDLPSESVLHAGLVNELQIELGSEERYVERLRDLETQIQTMADAEALDVTGLCELQHENQASTELRTLLETCRGAQFVFDAYKQVLPYLSNLKAEDILDAVDDALDTGRYGPAPAELDWGPSEHSKGVTALMMLTGRL